MNKKNIIIFAFFCFISNYCTCQTINYDSLFTNYGVIIVEIKDVGNENIKYSFPKEDLIKVMPMSALYKIRYKNGRVQLFTKSEKPIIQNSNENVNKPTLKISNELLYNIISEDCEIIRAKAPCTVSTKCDFRVLNFADKGQNIYLVKIESIGFFYNINLSLYYEIVIDDVENIKYTLQKVTCN